ncbi:MAG: glycosyltransferase family 4 protein [Chloroflexi bacterium]|nr:glycosyltransferase family 4 protein [Chloroflexota bacterium]
MRIAINGFFWDQPNTGSGQYVRALVAALKERAPQNDYVVVAPSAVSGQRSAVAHLRENLDKVWFEQIAFARACRRERATLAHVPYFGSPFFSPTRTVVTIHDLIPIVLPAYRGSILVRAYTALAAICARRADAIIADSECSKRDIIARLKIAAARVRVVYLAADARYRAQDDAAQIEIVRRKYALPEKYLLYLGGYDQRKNVRVIIAAFARAPEFYRAGYRLMLAGVNLGRDPEVFPDPRQIARDAQLAEDALALIGWVDEADKPALYSGASAFLFPAVYEGFGLPPLEAMACGTPVICANASSLPEVVGDAAIRLPPDDADAWADAIRAVLTDDARRVAMRARGIAQARQFSWTRCAAETLAVYNAQLTNVN